MATCLPKAFFKWFDDGPKEDLQELRVTGGELNPVPNFGS